MTKKILLSITLLVYLQIFLVKNANQGFNKSSVITKPLKSNNDIDYVNYSKSNSLKDDNLNIKQDTSKYKNTLQLLEQKQPPVLKTCCNESMKVSITGGISKKL